MCEAHHVGCRYKQAHLLRDAHGLGTQQSVTPYLAQDLMPTLKPGKGSSAQTVEHHANGHAVQGEGAAGGLACGLNQHAAFHRHACTWLSLVPCTYGTQDDAPLCCWLQRRELQGPCLWAEMSSWRPSQLSSRARPLGSSYCMGPRCVDSLQTSGPRCIELR
jgi:hypothetical protein